MSMNMDAEAYQWQTILKNLPDSIIITDKEGIIIDWLASSEKIFGFSAAETLNQPLESFLQAPPEKQITTDEFAEGISCRHKNGTDIIIRIVNKKTLDIGILWVVRDITAFKKIEWLMNTFHDEVQREQERLVSEKTADLKSLNDQLETRVAERTRELEIMQHKLVERAHRAGMAEVAIQNLHNIGNILNNITTSIYFLDKNLETMDLERFHKANDLFTSKLTEIRKALPSDSLWPSLADYYQKLEATFSEKYRLMKETGKKLESRVEEINYIISDQNYQHNFPVFYNIVNINELLERTLAHKKNLICQEKIQIIKEFDEIPAMHIQKLKLGYVFSCLLDYMIDSMESIPPDKRVLNIILRKVLTIIQNTEKSSLMIQLKGTGAGIQKEELKKIFNQGYTKHLTRHHVDLHTCANYVLEMNGKIMANNRGPEEGLGFTILINLK